MALRRILTALLLTLVTGTSALAAQVDELGTVDFAGSCAPAVQLRLQRAVALLHSF